MTTGVKLKIRTQYGEQIKASKYNYIATENGLASINKTKTVIIQFLEKETGLVWFLKVKTITQVT